MEKQKMNDYKKMVLEHLEKKYQKRGADFYFKSKRISMNLDVSKHLIGKIVKELEEEGNPAVVVITDHIHGPNLYKTGFSCIT